MNKTSILLIACLGLTIFSGILRGRIDYRWGVSEEFQAAADKVNAMPTVIGGWKTEKLNKLDDQAKNMLRCTGDVFGSYTNRQGERVSVTVLVGPAGPLAIHTAEVCYGSSNFTLLEGGQRKVVTDSEGTEHEFAVATFEENNAGKRPLKVYYAWSSGGNWEAPKAPRSAFAGTPMLYKIQIATNIDGRSEGEMDPAEKFLSQNLHKLQELCGIRAKSEIKD